MFLKSCKSIWIHSDLIIACLSCLYLALYASDSWYWVCCVTFWLWVDMKVSSVNEGIIQKIFGKLGPWQEMFVAVLLISNSDFKALNNAYFFLVYLQLIQLAAVGFLLFSQSKFDCWDIPKHLLLRSIFQNLLLNPNLTVLILYKFTFWLLHWNMTYFPLHSSFIRSSLVIHPIRPLNSWVLGRT